MRNRNRYTPPLDQPWYGIGFGNAVVRFFRKTFVYGGRASRGEYWWAWLFMLIIDVAVIAAANGVSPSDDVTQTVTVVLELVWLLPSLSLGVRRLHDENLSGWWYLVPLGLQVGAFAALFGGFIAGVAAGSDVSAAVLIVTMLAALGLDLLSNIIGMVLMLLPSNPRGARFDLRIAPDAPPYRGSAGSAGSDGPSMPVAPSGR